MRLGLMSGIMAVIGKAIFPPKKEERESSAGEKVRLLAQDGKLVEVDKRALEAATRKKATNAEIRNFVDHRNKHIT